jgi:sn-glycerol 3-phosphate transport system substrate-binding protein
MWRPRRRIRSSAAPPCGCCAAGPTRNIRRWRGSSPTCRNPGVQAAWHQNTGYLPATQAAYELTRAQGFYDRNPGAAISIEQINHKPPTENSRGLRLGSFVLIRDVIEDELEQALAGKKSAKAALDSAVARGNELLRQFERATR